MAEKNALAFIFVTVMGVFIILPIGNAAKAHDPVFGLGPHVLFKGGVETALHIDRSEKGDSKNTVLKLETTYGLTGDWAAGIELPYVFKDDKAANEDGFDNIELFTKYRFWRHDTLGVQESASALLKLDLDTAGERIGSGANDAIWGLTYGYESNKWYRWAAARYRINGETDAGLDRGNKWLFDVVGGIRPWPVIDYYKPDTVVMLELNGEYTQESSLNGADLTNTGGTELFLSPGIFWTYRNFAIKSGVELPVYSNLNGTQAASDYRANLTFELHL